MTICAVSHTLYLNHMLIKWDATLMVGVPSIDGQHRKLVDLINQLNEAMKRGQGHAALGDILKEMVDYTRYHFAFEEKLMAQHGYPESKTHLLNHDSLNRQVFEFQIKYAAGKAALTIPAMKFLRSWLMHHIQVTDKEVGAYLHAHGAQ